MGVERRARLLAASVMMVLLIGSMSVAGCGETQPAATRDGTTSTEPTPAVAPAADASTRDGATSTAPAPAEVPAADASPAPRADGAAPAPAALLPGSDLDLSTALTRASTVVVGEVLDAGFASPSSPAVTDYDRTRIRVVERLRGPRTGPDEVSLYYHCQNPPLPREEPAALGGRYVFFIETGTAGPQAIKILAATPEVLAAARRP